MAEELSTACAYSPAVMKTIRIAIAYLAPILVIVAIYQGVFG